MSEKRAPPSWKVSALSFRGLPLLASNVDTLNDKMASSGDCSEGGCAYGFLQYEPSLVGNAVLLALFAVLVPIAFALGIRYHSSIFSTTIITGLFLEIIGYAGRVLLATGDGGHRVDFALSHIGTILAPAFIALAVFRLMPPIVAAYGEQFRAWRPRWHNAVFYIFTAAVVALQVAGGVLSTVPASSTLVSKPLRLEGAQVLTDARERYRYPPTCRRVRGSLRKLLRVRSPRSQICDSRPRTEAGS